jgi:hypothetical protein
MLPLASLILMAALQSASSQAASPQPVSPQVAVTTAGTLVVFYPAERQVIVYERLAEKLDDASAQTKIDLAAARYRLAMQIGDTSRALKANEELAAARRAAQTAPPSDQTYHCVNRYEIPMSPVASIKSLTCNF